MHRLTPRRAPRETPISGRIFIAVLLAAAGSLGPSAEAQPRWTRADVVRRAQTRAPDAEVARREAELLQAHADAVGRPPDPSVSWNREQVFGGPDPSQDVVSVRLPVDLSGRRHAERALARADSANAEASAALDEQRAVTWALLAFYEAIGAQRRAEITEQRIDALDRVSGILEAREQAGTASGFERRRLEIEAELARSERAARRSEAAAARARLLAWLAPDRAEPPQLAGELDTEQPASLEALVRDATAAHPALEPAQRAVGIAGEARDAAAAAWVPTVALTGGYNVQRAANTRHGYVVGAALDLPIFSRKRALSDRAAAMQRLARARTDRLARAVRRDVAQARARLVAARRELARFEEATGEPVRELLKGAETSYREGRREIMVMLDAHRAASDVRARRLTLRLEAKRAEVALHGATGRW